MSPLFRFTLSNSVLGPLVITEPGGWDQAVMKLERDEEYHSIVETYDQPLTFTGSSIEGNGGLEYIRQVEDSQGPDAQIAINIELSEDDGDTYSSLFNGLLKISTVHEHDFYALECGVIRNDLWSKFLNRKGTPVDLSSTTDLDGGTRTAVTPFTLSLPCQVTRKKYTGTMTQGTVLSFIDINHIYVQIDFDEQLINEIATKYNIPVQLNTVQPVFLWEMAEDGAYAFDIRIEISYEDGMGTTTVFGGAFFYQVNANSAVALAVANFSSGGKDSTVFSFAGTLNLAKGDQVTIVGFGPPLIFGEDWYLWGVTSFVTAPSLSTRPTYVDIVADTTYPDTTCETFQIGAAAESIISKLVGQNSVVTSDYILSSNCGAYFGLTRGLNIRGYSLSQKPFTMSFDEWWEGANGILNLGLGYNGNNIEILKKDDFYNPLPIINLDYVNKIERSYNEKVIYKTIEIGYDKWSAESDSGVDDPQTRHTYRTGFKTVGEDIKIKSKFFAASLGIEQTRRNRAEQGKDWRLDEDVIIIALKVGVARPELGSDLSAVTNLLNSNSRYNIRISPGHNFMRWRAFLNGAQTWFIANDDFYFASGEGNVAMTSTIADACDDEGNYAIGAMTENGNIDGGGSGVPFLFLPIVYEFEYPLTFEQYKLIRSNPKNAIGVSRTNTGHVACFITELAYQPTHGKGKFTVILGQLTPL